MKLEVLIKRLKFLDKRNLLACYFAYFLDFMML